MKFCSIISIRNVLRASGVVTICVGAPMIIAPPLFVKMFFGKREDTPEHDKNALHVATEGAGLGLTASGIRSLLSPVSKQALGAALYMEAMYTCYHVCNRFCGRIKDAKGNEDVSTAFLCANIAVVALQIVSLCCGDEPDEEEEKEE